MSDKWTRQRSEPEVYGYRTARYRGHWLRVRASPTFQTSGAIGPMQIGFVMVTIPSAERHVCGQSPNSRFIQPTPGTTVFVGLHGRF